MSDLEPDVAGVTEAAAMLKVSKTRLFALRREDPRFPPARVLASGPIWWAPALRAYAHDRRGDRRQSPRSRLLMSYRKLGNAHAAATSQGIAYTTARRWLIESGVPLGREPRD